MFRSILPLLLAFFAFTSVSAAAAPQSFIADADALFKQHVQSGRVDYASLKSSGAIDPLVAKIAAVDLSSLSGNERKAYLINAYNILVINQALENYPLKSVMDVSGFFDGKKQTVGGRKLTLNQLEKELLLKEYNDARLHFVLVCGATGCPPITNFAYTAGKLEAQLDQQTKAALNDATFIRTSGSTAQLSQIFDWYKADFGGSKTNVVNWINQYRKAPIAANATVSYYPYDWSLNKPAGSASVETPTATDATPSSGGGNNASRYVVSSTIPKGSVEVKIFNNLYSQEAANERSSFFTSLTSAIYGVSDRINVGLDVRVRRVRYDQEGLASNFDVLRSGGDYSRTTVATIGPKVRIAPFNQLPNFSIQSAFWIPVGDDLTGAENGGRFVDFDGPTWFTQVFNDFPIGDNFSFFAEVDFNLEDIGSKEAGRINRFSTPLTGIVSYFPTPKATIYGLASYAPYWQSEPDYFYQLGAGAKYQFTPNLELELLYTAFDNQFLSSVDGNASTVNLGLRFNL
ncbi:DUF547 domain-containing protein [Lewinella sp. 4G2]|uniref:DUF547 domain-containing protein n=1 Tax=Lewinella sp. 4G2 TaxID=1803372 RepID=UPI0007B4B71A|nr:DUF547 domain-containing protein [Lewinella sp. 4G2]OAV44256.1 hypothetical protein A3850_006995 [Lewinella sp. 4G2]